MSVKMGTLAHWDALGLPRESVTIDHRPRPKGHNNAPAPQQRPQQQKKPSVADRIIADRKARGMS
jgi:hypothetical protein